MTVAALLALLALLPQPVAARTCLAATVYLEARNQPVKGQVAVAEVAVRRLASGRHGATLCAVVTAPRQFALTEVPTSYPITDPAAWHTAWQVASSVLAAYRAAPAKWKPTVVPRATHFLRVGTRAPWAHQRPLAIIGEQAFYASR